MEDELMKKTLLLRFFATLFLWVLMISSSYATNNLKQLFDSLNVELSHKRMFAEQKRQRIEQIKQELNTPDTTLQHKYDIYTQLYNEYRKFVVDSAIVYEQAPVALSFRV